MPTPESQKQGRVCVGLIAWEEPAQLLVELAKGELSDMLEESFPGITWSIERIDIPEPGRKTEVSYFELARDEQVRRNLDYAFVAISDGISGGADRKTASLASRSLRAGIIPVKQSGTPQDADELDEARVIFQNLFLHLLGYLLGLDDKRGSTGVMGLISLDLVQPTPLRFSQPEVRDARALLDAAARRGRVELLPEMSKGLAYFKVAFLHPIQIVRRALAAKPWRLVTRLHKLVFPALVAVPLALISQEVWDIAVHMNGLRLAGIAVAVVIFMSVFIIMKQKLLEKMPRERPSDQIALHNLSTVLAILLAVTIVLAVIFVATLIITVALFPRKIVMTWLHASALRAGGYLRVSLLIAILSSLIGWLGAGFTESDEFRLMLYTGARSR